MLSDKLLPDQSPDDASALSYASMECNIRSDPKKRKQANKSLCRLYMAIIFCFLFMAAEFVAGWLANSIAVWSDGFHMFSDLIGFLFNIFGLRLTLKAAGRSWTYGYDRVEIIAALFSIFFLWVIIGLLCVKAVGRIKNPPPVDGKVMVITGCLGMLTNIILAAILTIGMDNEDDDDDNPGNFQETKGKQCGSDDICSESDDASTDKEAGNISVETAFIHALGDLIQNIGVVVAGSMIWWDKKYFLLDPICTLFFAVLVLVVTTPIISNAIYLLMEAVPKSVDTKALIRNIRGVKYVTKLKDLHVWDVGFADSALTVKVDVACECQCVPVSRVREQIIKIAEKRHINHCNIEVRVVPTEECGGITSTSQTNGETCTSQTLNKKQL